MSFEISSTCSDEVAELERFYTPSSTDNPIPVKSVDSFHTPCGTPEEMPPRFINPIFDLEVPDGMDAVFDCSLTGVPLPKVIWFKDTVPIPKDGRKYIYSSKNNNHILEVRNVCSYDSGMYMCKAVNRAGETTCKHTLIIGSVEPEDHGEYSCLTSNAYGQTSCTAFLEVKTKEIRVITESSSTEVEHKVEIEEIRQPE
uniref:Ig-like domain-containing protein n=1 Tax=Erpetoichthys calabaricus TaxID=27687 RepID=A0A8C4S6N1_ERPCA